ncbi:MAG: hypothetical protein Q7V61_05640 [Actinomycetota bacterium]|nr:hypothetical protein [Actinomycetota bacterium]
MMTARVEWTTVSTIWDQNCDLNDALSALLEADGFVPGTQDWHARMSAIMEAGRTRRTEDEGPERITSIYLEAARWAGMRLGAELDAAIATVRAEQHDRLLHTLANELHEAFMEVRCQEDSEIAAMMAAARAERMAVMA